MILKGDTIPDKDSPELDELREFVTFGRDHITNQSTLTIRTLLVFACLSLPFLAGVALAFSYFFGSFLEFFLLVFSVLTIKHVTNVLLLINGTLEFGTFQSRNKIWPVQLLIYTGAIKLLVI